MDSKTIEAFSSVFESVFEKSLIIVLLAFAILLSACQEKGPMEKAGKAVDEGIEDAGEVVEDAGDEIEDAADGIENNTSHAN